MKPAEMVARLIVAREGSDVDANINAVIAEICRDWDATSDEIGGERGEPPLMELALALLDGRIERGVKLKS